MGENLIVKVKYHLHNADKSCYIATQSFKIIIGKITKVILQFYSFAHAVEVPDYFWLESFDMTLVRKSHQIQMTWIWFWLACGCPDQWIGLNAAVLTNELTCCCCPDQWFYLHVAVLTNELTWMLLSWPMNWVECGCPDQWIELNVAVLTNEVSCMLQDAKCRILHRCLLTRGQLLNYKIIAA